jgi:cytochrome c peroxidase
VLRRQLIALAMVAASGCVEDATGPCAGLDDAACDAVLALALPATLPPSPGNAHADDLAAAELGFEVFFAPGFAPVQDVRCATCHLPELSFRDRGPVSQGLAAGTRNSPTILDAARQQIFFWDGRADSLWSQPLFAFENPLEMDFTRLEIAHRLAADDALGPAYELAFGALPELAALPPRGKPGDPAWDALSDEQAFAINQVAANVGKALEAYMRKAVAGPSALDAYLAGDAAALAPIAQRGLAVFVDAGCIDCHGGPTLSDGRYHDAMFPSLPGASPDPGRAAGAQLAVANIFNAAGPFADVAGPAPQPDDDAVGAFRTPSLRNVASTPPYGHDGALATLDDVFAVHAAALTPDEREDLTAFLLALEGDRPPRPWGDWPRPQ